jgi:Asp-tRNA(Asn)/Glu-tRNA(Gln) amidotransferase A subunit family amidase
MPGDLNASATGRRVHAYGDDALADHDGTRIAELVRAGELSVAVVTEAAIARAEKVQPLVGATTRRRPTSSTQARETTHRIAPRGDTSMLATPRE